MNALMERKCELMVNVFLCILSGCAAFALVMIGVFLIVLLPKINAIVRRIKEEVAPKIGNVIENLDGVTKSFQELSETEIKPMMNNIQNLTGQLNEEIPKIGTTLENVNSITGNVNGITASIQQLSETEIKGIAGNIQEITGRISEEEIPKLGTTFENVSGITGNVNGITSSIQQLSETEIKGIVGNIQEITGKVNEDLAKVDEVVTATTDFTKNTIEKVEFYRDKLFVPIIDILSFWNAVKTGLASISQKKNDKRGGDSNG